MIFQPLGFFVTTFTAAGKYFLRNSKNLQQPIQMEIFKNLKTFSEHFPQLLKSTSYFKLFENNDDPMYFSSYRLWNAWLDKGLNSLVSTAPFYDQHVKGSQKLLESPLEYLYRIILSLLGKLTWKTSLVSDIWTLTILC